MDIIIRNKRTYQGSGEYIGRPSVLGNPFSMNGEADRENVIKQYRQWLYKQVNNTSNVQNKLVNNELHRLLQIARKDKLNLICWCAPKACHGCVKIICAILGKG